MNGRMVLTAMVLVMALPAAAFSGQQRQQFLEPLRPDRPEAASPAPCYCWTEHQKNAAGLKTWRKVCSTERPEHGATSASARDCKLHPKRSKP